MGTQFPCQCRARHDPAEAVGGKYAGKLEQRTFDATHYLYAAFTPSERAEEDAARITGQIWLTDRVDSEPKAAM